MDVTMDMTAAAESTRRPSGFFFFMAFSSLGAHTPAPGSCTPTRKKGPPLRATEAALNCKPKPLPHRQPLACGAFFVQLAAMLQAL